MYVFKKTAIKMQLTTDKFIKFIQIFTKYDVYVNNVFTFEETAYSRKNP